MKTNKIQIMSYNLNVSSFKSLRLNHISPNFHHNILYGVFWLKYNRECWEYDKKKITMYPTHCTRHRFNKSSEQASFSQIDESSV